MHVNFRPLRTLPVSLALLLALPGAAGAATVRVEPFREPPEGSACGKYSGCPADMVVFTAAPGEVNDVSIAYEALARRGNSVLYRYLVRDHSSTIQPGGGCERVDMFAVACRAESLGPVELGDLEDRVSAPDIGGHPVSGGTGDDVLAVPDGEGGPGDDVLTGTTGDGGPGNDLLRCSPGQSDFCDLDGGRGNDLLRCLPRRAFCDLDGGPGNDRLIGGQTNSRDPGKQDNLLGGGGRDFLDGRAGNDKLEGGSGNDRLRGGGGRDVLRGGTGADRLEARELRSLGERTARDVVSCGTGRRDRAIVDRRDRVTRCERVTRPRRAR